MTLSRLNDRLLNRIKALQESGSIKHEIFVNVALFIAIMLIAKLFSMIWKFRTYRKTYKKYQLPKKVREQAQIRLGDGGDSTRKPANSIPVRSRSDFKRLIRTGQHYAVRRNYAGFVLYHHFLVSDVTEDGAKILHYNGEAAFFMKSASKVFGHIYEEAVKFTDTHCFDIPHNLYRIIDPNYPQDEILLKTAIEKARKRIGENIYGMTYNNCEHFARWALTGKPSCEQYETANISDKVVGAMVDELPNIGMRMSMKLCKEVLFGLTIGVEQLVLQSSARLIQHTAAVSMASLLSTGAATFGWTAPVEAAFLTFRILDWKYHMGKGRMSVRDYNNAKDKAITGSVFSLVLTTFGAIFGQLFVPYPAVGAVSGSFLGGFIGRVIGIVLAGYGIAIKEKYLVDPKQRRRLVRHVRYKKVNRYVNKWKQWIHSIQLLVKSTASWKRKLD